MRAVAIVAGMLFLVAFTFSLGLHVTPALIKEELARPWRLVRGIVLDLALAPLATLLCVRALGLSGAVAIALVIVAVAPGAPLSPATAKKAGGSIPAALLLTIVLGFVTAFTAAPSARWILGYEGDVRMRPPILIAKLLLLQLLPLATGALLQRRWPGRVAATFERIAKALLVISGGLLVVLSLIPILPKLTIIGWRGLAAILLSMVVVVGVAWLMGGRDRQLSRTLEATVSVPNVGLAVAMAHAAGAPQTIVSAIAAIFVVRLIANQLLVRSLAAVSPSRAASAEPQV